MKKICAGLAVAATLAFSATASAAPVAYAHPGVENAATYDLVAAATGDITAYFAGSDASYTNELTMYVNGVATGTFGMNNHASHYGDQINFGSVKAGDKLVFELLTLNPGNVGPWYSDRARNTDGLQHIYSAAFSGDNLVPAGTYVGFEDLPAGGDFDYNDENFVFTNVAVQGDTAPSNVPEPASLALLLVGALGFGVRRTASRAERAA